MGVLGEQRVHLAKENQQSADVSPVALLAYGEGQANISGARDEIMTIAKEFGIPMEQIWGEGPFDTIEVL